MDFSEALVKIRLGQRVARRGWNGKGMWVGFMPGYPGGISANAATQELLGVDRPIMVKISSYLVMWTVTGELVPWVASQTDILALDWELVEPSK